MTPYLVIINAVGLWWYTRLLPKHVADSIGLGRLSIIFRLFARTDSVRVSAPGMG